MAMNPDWLKWIKEGEYIVLAAIGVILFWVYRFPYKNMNIKIDGKIGEIECEKKRGNCNVLLVTKLDAIATNFSLKIENVVEKLDDITERQKEAADRLDKFLTLNNR